MREVAEDGARGVVMRHALGKRVHRDRHRLPVELLCALPCGHLSHEAEEPLVFVPEACVPVDDGIHMLGHVRIRRELLRDVREVCEERVVAVLGLGARVHDQRDGLRLQHVRHLAHDPRHAVEEAHVLDVRLRPRLHHRAHRLGVEEQGIKSNRDLRKLLEEPTVRVPHLNKRADAACEARRVEKGRVRVPESVRHVPQQLLVHVTPMQLPVRIQDVRDSLQVKRLRGARESRGGCEGEERVVADVDLGHSVNRDREMPREERFGGERLRHRGEEVHRRDVVLPMARDRVEDVHDSLRAEIPTRDPARRLRHHGKQPRVLHAHLRESIQDDRHRLRVELPRVGRRAAARHGGERGEEPLVAHARAREAVEGHREGLGVKAAVVLRREHLHARRARAEQRPVARRLRDRVDREREQLPRQRVDVREDHVPEEREQPVEPGHELAVAPRLALQALQAVHRAHRVRQRHLGPLHQLQRVHNLRELAVRRNLPRQPRRVAPRRAALARDVGSDGFCLLRG
mmetsp:Transcript_18376/g.41352  ORF Transcript_18376/g.41352 Transcript_18376/m.41352 type:complete len:516 (-) Transcript_18376:689-2236(-)